MTKKVKFNTDYTGQYGAGRAGQVRTISQEAFDDLKSKGIVNIYHEPKAEQKELKAPTETKELKITGKQTK